MQAPPFLHPSEQTLRAFGNGELDGSSAEAITTHLDECEDCLLRVAGLSSDGFLDAFRKARSGDGRAPVETPSDRAGLRSIGLGLPRTAAHPTAASTVAEGVPEELANHSEYEILRELGRGGMGVVYLAHNRLMGRDEVLKVMGRHIIARPGVMDRFLREIRAVAQLRHPNIVTAHHAFRSGESLVFAMEYVEGLDLAKMVKARGPMPVGHACYYVQQAALGLQHAHERGMVHRDIKPGNLMLSRNGERALIKVLDFGLAKASLENKVVELSSGDGDQARRTGADLTLAGQMLGTPDFIAPEQIDDAQRADIRADIYSLGCTLYYLLSGGPPFQGETLYDILQAQHSIDARLLNFVRPEVPAELAALVAKMMAKEPRRRFQTPSEAAKALTPFLRKKAGGAGAQGSGAPPVDQPATSFSTAGSTQVSTSSAPAPAAGSAPVATRGQNRPEERWKSLIDFNDSDEDRPTVVAAKPVRKPPRWFWAAVAGVVSFAAIILCAGIIYRIVTDKGELVIETEDPQIEVLVKQAGKRIEIIDPQTKNRIELHSGNYELELWNEKPGLRLSTEKFTLKRGDKTVVSVWRDKPAGPGSSSKSINAESKEQQKEQVGQPDSAKAGAGDAARTIQPPKVAIGQVRYATEMVRFVGHTNGIWSLAISPDGLFLLTGSHDDSVRVWDMASGRELHCFLEHNGHVKSVVFLPDGRHALSGGDDDMVRLFDLENPREIHCFQGHTADVETVAVSSDGRHGLSGGQDRTVRLWDLEKRRESRKFEGHSAVVSRVAFLPDNKRALSASEDGTVRVWNLENGRELRTLSPRAGPLNCVAASPDGLRALGGCYDGTVHVWEIASGRELGRLDRHDDFVRSITFTRDGRHILTTGGYRDRTIRIWESAGFRQVTRLGGFASAVLALALSPDGRTVALTFDGTAQLLTLPDL